MADPRDSERRASTRRYALIAGIVAVVLLLLVLVSLFDACDEAGVSGDRIAPSEDVGPAPGVE